MVGACLAVLGVVLRRLLQIPASVLPTSRAVETELQSLAYSVDLGRVTDSDMDRAVAWCSRIWDTSSSKLAESALEKLRHQHFDADAATTTANLMVRATEAHMRASNWSSSAALSASSALGERYGEVLRAAAALLRGAAHSADHHGAHYSLAILLKLYPNFVTPGTDLKKAATSAAAHLCSSQRSTVKKLVEFSAGRAAALAAQRCKTVELVDDWAASTLVELKQQDEHFSLAIVNAPPGSKVIAEGTDAVVHDLPRSDAAFAATRSCRIYMGASGCYPALWRQFAESGLGGNKRLVTLPAAALVDGFSASTYYHWLLEALPRLLFLAEVLGREKRKLPVFLPHHSDYVDQTLHLLPPSLVANVAAFHFRAFNLAIAADTLYLPYIKRPVSTYADYGEGDVLKPKRAALLRVRDALTLETAPETPNTLVLVVRGRMETRTFGNEHAIAAVLSTLATQHQLNLDVFDGKNRTMAETRLAFASARLVVGVHGAGLANVIFCPDRHRAALLEVALPEPEFSEYRHVANALDIHYAATYLPHSNFEARAWPRPAHVLTAAESLLERLTRASRARLP